VLVDDDGARVRLTLNRPRLHNAYSAAMRDALVEALRALVAGDERPVLLVGAGPSFCAGGDPAEFGSVDDPATAHLIRTTANAAPWMDRLADRLTVRVHGAAVGAGVELAAFAHRVEATDDATFCLPEVSMGLIPGAGGTFSVPRRIGRQRTLAWCLEGATIDAATALAWGLVDQVD
jgi:enoyl-CoA hydratase/carnithine racemase